MAVDQRKFSLIVPCGIYNFNNRLANFYRKCNIEIENYHKTRLIYSVAIPIFVTFGSSLVHKKGVVCYFRKFHASTKIKIATNKVTKIITEF